jgi:hypothetical protein
MVVAAFGRCRADGASALPSADCRYASYFDLPRNVPNPPSERYLLSVLRVLRAVRTDSVTVALLLIAARESELAHLRDQQRQRIAQRVGMELFRPFMEEVGVPSYTGAAINGAVSV